MIKIVIAEDMISIRNRYEKLIEGYDDMKVVGIASNGYEAISETALHHPDIVLMDIEMESKYSGILATSQITSSFPDVKVIMLTVSEDDDAIFSSIQAGASNYIVKNTAFKDIVKMIRDVYNDEAVFDATISKKIRQEFRRIRNNEDILLKTISLMQLLTDSEKNILYCMHNGMTQNDVCKNLFIEKSTMKTHARNIIKKLECKNLEEAVTNLEKSGYFYYYEKMLQY